MVALVALPEINAAKKAGAMPDTQKSFQVAQWLSQVFMDGPVIRGRAWFDPKGLPQTEINIYYRTDGPTGSEIHQIHFGTTSGWKVKIVPYDNLKKLCLSLINSWLEDHQYLWGNFGQTIISWNPLGESDTWEIVDEKTCARMLQPLLEVVLGVLESQQILLDVSGSKVNQEKSEAYQKLIEYLERFLPF